MFIAIARFFDRLEDKVRIKLSYHPIFFSFIGGFAIVEFWRGVWHLTDWIFIKLGFDAYGLFSSLTSVVVSSFLLLITGLYVSLFLSDDSIILSGRRRETKKVFQRTEEEILEAEKQLPKLMAKIDLLTKEITDIKNELVKK
jgi:hypothetical protein